MSWRPDPFAVATDANWTELQGSFWCDWDVFAEGLSRGLYISSDSASLANTTLVTPIAGESGGVPHPIASDSEPANGPLWSIPFPGTSKQATASHLENIRVQHKGDVFSIINFESCELDGKIALIVGVYYACMPVLLGGTCACLEC